MIRFVRERFFAGRTFTGLADLNAQVSEFCRGVALARDWPEDKRRTVGAALEEERALLLPLPSEPFPCAEQVARAPQVHNGLRGVRWLGSAALTPKVGP